MARGLGVVLLLLGATIGSFWTAQAAPAADAAFQRTWERTDQPVVAGQANRTWMWGPEAFTPGLSEPYTESTGGQRLVQYYDKSRMEITHPSGDAFSDWYVTNGLLVVELISGRLQLGDNTFEQRAASSVTVAGDSNDIYGPTYATFTTLLDAPALPVGDPVIALVNRNSTVTEDLGLAVEFFVFGEYLDTVTGHTIADVFWEFMNSSGTVWEEGSYSQAPLFPDPFFATGRPITEAYWAEVKVADTYRDVLMQCFERRCLTYTPDNPEGWQVEAGNVGRHYYAWRYETGSTPLPPPSVPPAPPPDPGPDPGPDYDGVPAEGEVLYDTPMTLWNSVTDAWGNTGGADEGEYQLHLQPFPDGFLYSYESAGSGSFGDASYSVQVRRPSAFGVSAGCLAFNATFQSTYDLCLYFGDDSTIGFEATYFEAVGSSDFRTEILLTGDLDVGDPADWHTLKAVVQGEQFWFFIDNVYLGTVAYGGGLTVGGQIGVGGWNFEEALNVTLSYQNYVVRSIN